MNAELDSGAQFLASLQPLQRARFLVELAHNLTVVGRSLYHSDESRARVADDLYALNEIQHRVSSYAMHALGGDEDTGWLVPVLAYIFEQSNDSVRKEAEWAFRRVRERWSSFA